MALHIWIRLVTGVINPRVANTCKLASRSIRQRLCGGYARAHSAFVMSSRYGLSDGSSE